MTEAWSVHLEIAIRYYCFAFRLSAAKPELLPAAHKWNCFFAPDHIGALVTTQQAIIYAGFIGYF